MSVIAPLRPGPALDEAVGLDVVPAPSRRRPVRESRRLRPVSPPRPRRSPAVPVLVGVGIVLVALFALAAMHALLISGQVHLDAMRRDVASEHEQIRRLELREAELESPGRVLDAARQRLGMVEPGEVGYLLPAPVGAVDEAPVRVPAAEPAPEPEVDASADDPANDPADVADRAIRPENGAEPIADDAVATDAPNDATGDLPSEGGRDE